MNLGSAMVGSIHFHQSDVHVTAKLLKGHIYIDVNSPSDPEDAQMAMWPELPPSVSGQAVIF